MNIAQRIRHFTTHRLRSKTRHGIHSPFVYAFIDECIYADGPDIPWEIHVYYESLRSNKTVLKGMDHGRGVESERTVADHVMRSALPKYQAELLHRMVDYLQPERVLELGTNLGRSLAAMASAKNDATFIGVEGNEALASFARESMEVIKLDNTEVVCSKFDDFLVNTPDQYDLVFVDGDHHFAPTMRYFNALKGLMKEEGAIIFHDIYWSDEMRAAWEEIKKDRDVTVTLDLFFFGIVWMGKPQAKQDFQIKFPLQLTSLLF